MRTATSVLIALAALFASGVLSRPVIFFPDSEYYLHFSWLLHPDPYDLSLFRTPGYPALLAFGQLFTSSDFAAVRLGHALVATLTIVGVAHLLRHVIPPVLTATIVALSLYFGLADWFCYCMSEWSAICLLLLTYCLFVRTLSQANPKSLFWLSLLACLSVLIRQQLVIIIFLPLIAWACSKESCRGRIALRAIGLGLTPLVLWLIVNGIRVGQLGSAPLRDINLLGVASLIGAASLSDADSTSERQFFEFVNRNRINGPDFNSEVKLVPQTRPFDFNVWYVSRYKAQQLGLSGAEWAKYSADFARSVFRSHPGGHFSFFIDQFLVQNKFVPPSTFLWLAVIIVSSVCLSSKGLNFLAPGVQAALVLHLVHTSLCAFHNVMFPRLFLSTFAPLAILYVVQIIGAIWQAEIRKLKSA